MNTERKIKILGSPEPSVKKQQWGNWVIAILLLVCGLGLRWIDLTDEPLDFHPTRQLRGAIIARSIYYEHLPNADPLKRDMAIAFAGKTGQYEPPILESLVAYTYLLTGGERIWIARIYSSIFWVIGGIGLFLLASRITSRGAAIFALIYYLFLPFGTQASRTFQPDPGMVMWLVWFFYALYSWSEQPKWGWTILAGVCGGMAIFTKAIAVYMVAIAAVTVVISSLGFKRSFKKPQVWIMALLMITPSLIFYLAQNQTRAAEYFSSWTVALSHLILEPQTYVRWFNLLQNLMGITILALALIGVLICPAKIRTFMLSLWIGYFVYGLTVPYQMYTHNYYHLALIPILALSLAPVVQVLLEKIRQKEDIWQALSVGVILLCVVFLAWISITSFISEDYRQAPAYWQKIGSLLPSDGKILALTQDYGYPLLYYGWRKVTLWQTSGELQLANLRGWEKDFEGSFSNRIEGMDYFLITAFNQFDTQTQLKSLLYDNYPILADEKGYLIFNLAHPLSH